MDYQFYYSCYYGERIDVKQDSDEYNESTILVQQMFEKGQCDKFNLTIEQDKQVPSQASNG